MWNATLRHWVRAVLIVYLLGLLWGMLAKPPLTCAAEYDQLPVDKKVKRDLWFTFRDVLQGTKPLQENQDKLRSYLQQHFSEMTQLDSLGQVKNLRKEFNRGVRLAKSEDALQYVNQVTLSWLEKLCTKNFDPAVLFNFTLIIGDLDQKLSSSIGGEAQAPVPLAAALPVLLKLLKDNTYHDVVKVAAEIGLERHARYGLPPDQKDSVTAAVLAVLTARQPPGDRTAEGHEWMRRLAADVLARIGEVGAQNRVLDALVATLNEKDASVSLRCTAAEAIGTLKYEAGQRIEGGPVIEGLGRLAVEALQQDAALAAKRLKEKQRAEAAVVGARGNEEPISSARATIDKKPEEVMIPRRRLAYHVKCVRQATEAIVPLVDEPAKALGQQLIHWMNGVQDQLVRKATDDVLLAAVTKVRDEMATKFAVPGVEPAVEGEAVKRDGAVGSGELTR